MIAADVTLLLRPAEPAFVTRVRLRARRRVRWLRRQWADAGAEPDQGLAISHAEADRLLGAADGAEEDFYDTDADCRGLAEQIDAADRQAGEGPRWRRLCDECALGPADADLLTLAAAVEVDPGLRRVYGYLHDDATAGQATPWLAAGLFGWPAGRHLGAGAGLARWGLARPAEGAGAACAALTPWAADPAVVAWLAAPEADLAAAVALGRAGPGESECLYPALAEEMTAFVRALGEGPVAVSLVGPPGSGRRTLAAQVCRALGLELLVADAGALVGAEVPPALARERALRALRAARLGGAALYWHDAAAAAPRAWEGLPGAARLTFFASAGPGPVRPPGGAAWRPFRLPPLTRARREALWRRRASGPVPAPVAEWSLTPAQVAAAAAVAPAGPEAVADACRPALDPALGPLASPLACPYVWDDLVLAPEVGRHLAELTDQVRLRAAVYEDWGFGRLCPVGRGVTALFAGPSGTGKTMAAQVLARRLGMGLYRVDLAGLMSKYVGETPKHLRQLFDGCERANVVLFFDEADAVFGQRTRVKDAHDRYANIEIDYLLQRMEQYDGLAVLATNRKGDLDTAFLRRVRFIIDFLQPGPAERRQLWRRALPEGDGERLLDGIDHDRLADRLSLSGADIKAAALAAAFLAKAEGAPIGMRHVLHAVRRELAKHGRALRPEELEG